MRFLDNKIVSAELRWTPYCAGLGFHYYFNIWLTFYVYVGPVWVDVTFYKIRRKL